MTTAENILSPRSPAPVASPPRRAARPASTALAKTARPAFTVWWTGLAAALAWLALGVLTYTLAQQAGGLQRLDLHQRIRRAGAGRGGRAGGAGPGARSHCGRVASRARPAGPWLIALAAGLALWEILTAKLGLLPPPFFAPPQSLIEVYVSDWPRLLDSAANSLQLLAIGVALGSLTGFLVGVLIGWSRRASYWIHPVLRVLGPLPTTALLPISFYFFPSSWSTAVFLIALGTGFPVAILTWSGVAGVNRNFYDVARTLGASPWFLVLRVAIPAALPQVFVGLFMGLGHAFATLVVAEMLGVKSGLGWYLTWAQGWAATPICTARCW